MESKSATVEAYLSSLPPARKQPMADLRSVLLKNLPEGFSEGMSYGMIGYHVPHSIYPDGYHANPKQPLPFINLASQKNYIALYHLGLYADKGLLSWFTTEYAKRSKGKLDMGKSCIRFKEPDHIPFDLIGELAAKISMNKWVEMYEKQKP